MSWKTCVGDRCLAGPEADLVRETVDWMHDDIVAGLEHQVAGIPYGIPVFDQLSPTQKLAILEKVLRNLITPTPTPPPLTAVNEGAVAAIYAAMVRLAEIEFDTEGAPEDHDDDAVKAWRGDDPGHDKFWADEPPSNLYEWRKNLLAVAAAVCEGEGEVEFPEPSCRDLREWEFLVELLSARVLWDADYLEADLMLDARPSNARGIRQTLGIDRDYFVAIPPDPKDSEIPAIRKRLHALCRGK